MVCTHSLPKTKGLCSTGTTDLSEQTNRPLITGGCSVLICQSGRASVSVDFKRLPLKKGDALMMFTGTVFTVHRVSESFFASYCMAAAGIEDEAVYNIPWDFYDFLYAHPVCPTTSEQYELLTIWQRQMEWFARMEELPGQSILIRNGFQNLYLSVNNEIKRFVLPSGTKNSRSRELLNRFYILIRKNCNRERSAKFYADRLCITPYYLYKITRAETGMSPKELIDLQAVVAIKMYLTNTDLPVNKIAEEMNFEDPSYMNRFFRRRAGVSLTEYRAEYR